MAISITRNTSTVKTWTAVGVTVTQAPDGAITITKESLPAKFQAVQISIVNRAGLVDVLELLNAVVTETT